MKKIIKKTAVKFWKEWGINILVAVLIATSFKSVIADWNDVPTGSMKPTILEGDRVFVNKLAYDLKIPYTQTHLATWQHPQRGDIVVCFSPVDRTRLVKRVIAVPGDVLQMQNNQLYINSKPITYKSVTPLDRLDYENDLPHHGVIFEEYLPGKTHAVMFMPRYWSENSFASIEIPENKYFLMGDNRDDSADSRYFGLVDRKAIVGKASAVVLSRKNSFLHPRWNRFFSALN
ncbi:signal peptidase I [candidate division KSB1 bacterium]|nr:signal peptidase I [candidate division KSB1 bacterium]